MREDSTGPFVDSCPRPLGLRSLCAGEQWVRHCRPSRGSTPLALRGGAVFLHRPSPISETKHQLRAYIMPQLVAQRRL